MDIRTGKTYETKDAARAAGVPESDIAEIVLQRDTEYWPSFSPPNPRCAERHQGDRERRRRERQVIGEATDSATRTG